MNGTSESAVKLNDTEMQQMFATMENLLGVLRETLAGGETITKKGRKNLHRLTLKLQQCHHALWQAIDTKQRNAEAIQGEADTLRADLYGIAAASQHAGVPAAWAADAPGNVF